MITQFQKEISIIIILKIIAIALIWSIWFSDSSEPEVANHLIFTPAASKSTR